MTNRPDEDDQWWYDEPDARAVLRLFFGTTWPPGVSSPIRRLTPEEERESRKALADLLRSIKRPAVSEWLPKIERREALFREACHQLADLIDPDCKSPRKISFKKLQGKLAQPGARWAMVQSVKKHLEAARAAGQPISVEKAVANAADDYDLRDTRYVWRLWSREQSRRKPARRRRTSP